jgi:hypothetical protein
MKGPHCADIYLQAMRFCLPNTSELVKHKFWDCIQAGGCGDGPHLSCMNSAGLDDNFNWKQAIIGERIPKK